MTLRSIQAIRRGLVTAWPRGRRSLIFDATLALTLIAAEVATVVSTGGSEPAPIVFAVSSGAALAFRRVTPLAALGVTGVAMVACAAVGGEPLGLAVLVAVYTTAVACERRVSLAALALTAAISAVVDGLGGDSAASKFYRAAAAAGITTGVWILGAYVQTRRRYLRTLEERAVDAEREREQLARIAVHEQRAAIARELHDIVAHSVSVMLVGVRGARDVLKSSPDVAEDTLSRVETSGERSLAELRRILALLRNSSHDADSRPQPSLAELRRLVSDYRAVGLPVALELTGPLPPLPEGVELSVYRIVEEALTNALKHSRPSDVSVTLGYRDRQLELEVTSDGAAGNGEAPVVAGHGLIGMRERVGLLGGELEAGPRPGGEFRVSARLPVEAGR